MVTRIDLAILPSARGFGTSLTRTVAPGVAEAGKTSGKRFGDFFTKTSLGPLRAFGEAAAGIFAVEKIGEFFKSSIETARTAQKLQQEVAQAIKSTGGAAGVTAKHVDSLSSSLSNATGVSRLQIESGARLLLTFTGIRNEVGKGNAIFDRATKATNNLAAGMGVALPSAARAVGRALNDPTKGMALLTRYGIQLSDSTVGTIKSLQAQGKTLQAQKIILDQLNTRFGGAAKASTTMGERLSTAFENVKERIGQALIPALDGLERLAVTKVLPGLENAGAAAGRFFDSLKANSTVQATFRAIGSALSAVGATVRNLVTALGPFVRILAKVGGAALIIGFRALAGVLDGIARAVAAVTGFLAKNRTAAATLAGALTGLLIPSLVRTAKAAVAVKLEGLSTAVYKVSYAVSGLVGAFNAAGGGLAGFGALLGTSSVRFGLAGAAIAANYYIMAKATDAAKGSADDYINSLHVNVSSLSALHAALTTIRAKMYSTIGNDPTNHGYINELAQSLVTLGGKYDALNTTETQLSKTMGVGKGRAEVLAQRFGIDLTQGAAKAQAAMITVRDAIALSHHPIQAANADFKNMSRTTQTTATNIGLLDTAWQDLIGNFVGAKAAVAQAKDNIVTLNQDLAKSHGSLSTNTAAGRVAVEQLATTSTSVNQAIDGIFNKTGRWTKGGQAAVQQLVDKMTSGLPKGSAAAKRMTDGVTRYMAKLAQQAPQQGQKTGDGFAGGLSGSSGKVNGAAQSLIDSARQHLGNLSGIVHAGLEFTLGFAQGITSGTGLGAVVSGAVSLVTHAIAAIRSSKGQNSHSPARALIPHGVDFGRGYALGITRSSKHVVAAAVLLARRGTAALSGSSAHILKVLTRGLGKTVDAFKKVVAARLKAKDISKAMAAQLNQQADDFSKTWTARLDAVSKHLDALKSRLQATRTAAHDLSSSISGNLISGAELSNAGTASIAGVTGFLTQQNTGLKAFARNLALMRKHGFSNAVVNMVAGEGLDTGGPIAAQLAHATASQVRHIDQLERSIRQTSQGVGQDAATATYGAKLDAQTHELKSLNKNVRRIGGDLEDAESRMVRNRRNHRLTKTGKT